MQSRQGAGVFVVGNAASAFTAIGADSSNKISVALNVLEVRMGIDETHDARPAVAGLDQPLEREAADVLAAVEHDSTGRFPRGDPSGIGRSCLLKLR